MLHKRKAAGFNVAFLDVMSCGLGAVILVFMLVKFKVESPEIQSSALNAELVELQDKNQKTSQSSDRLKTQMSTLNANLAGLVARFKSIQNRIATQKSVNESLKKQIADLKKEEVSPQSSAPAPIPVSGKRLQDYFLGLKVEGRKIVMLIDSSASMMDERLVDIIKYKVSSPAQRIKAPKWERTRRIVEWLVARTPPESEYMVIRFAEDAKVVGGGGWKKGADPADAVAVTQGFSKIIPGGGTNLGIAVEAMRRKAKGFTDVYIVTDGLPTQSSKKLSSLFAGCSSIVGRGTTISGECRVKLFKQVISDYKESAKVNLVLLPLEGDPFASAAFWQWASRTKGMLISPETSWP